MAPIKLAPLPDRSPVKVVVMLPPELALALSEYSDFYLAAYGRAEPVSELIPAIISAFLESDREFVRSRKTRSSG